jgi:hypothetical protein
MHQTAMIFLHPALNNGRNRLKQVFPGLFFTGSFVTYAMPVPHSLSCALKFKMFIGSSLETRGPWILLS